MLLYASPAAKSLKRNTHVSSPFLPLHARLHITDYTNFLPPFPSMTTLETVTQRPPNSSLVKPRPQARRPTPSCPPNIFLFASTNAPSSLTHPPPMSSHALQEREPFGPKNPPFQANFSVSSRGDTPLQLCHHRTYSRPYSFIGGKPICAPGSCRVWSDGTRG